MHIVHVVSNVAEELGGPSYSIPALCQALATAGHSVRLHTLEPAPAAWPYPKVRHTVHPRLPFFPTFGFSPQMKSALAKEAETASVMHSHNLWMAPNFYPLPATRGKRCRLIVSPRGTLSQWALRHRRPLEKVLLWYLGQGPAVMQTSCIQATSKKEHDELRSFGLRNPIALIPNGVDIPDLAANHSDEKAPGQHRILFLGRIHEIKGLDVLIAAWAKVEPAFHNWELVIAGPDGGYTGTARDLARRLGAGRVRFLGATFGSAKARLLAGSDLFVLPSRTENFGMVVAEALAHGVATIASKGTPWPLLAEKGCGWWINGEIDAMAATLRDAMALSPQRRAEMGQRGRTWMETSFSWRSIAESMAGVYRWAVEGGAPPSCIELES